MGIYTQNGTHLQYQLGYNIYNSVHYVEYFDEHIVQCVFLMDVQTFAINKDTIDISLATYLNSLHTEIHF